MFELKPVPERPPRSMFAELGVHRCSDDSTINNSSPIRAALLQDILSTGTTRLKKAPSQYVEK